MIKTLRYRARMEWFGVELFDRLRGAVIKPDESEASDLGRLLKELLESQPYTGKTSGNPGEFILPRYEHLLSTYPLISNGVPDIEPLIDTPYPKNPVFASAPRRVYFELTRRCNLNCRSCFNRSFSDRPEMTITEIEKTAKALYLAGVYEIRCTGGEPTQRADFFMILEMLSDMGFYISVGTNGVYTPAILQKISHAPVDFMIVSIDGGDEKTNDRIRGEGSFKKALLTLERLAEKGCRLRINTLVRSDNHTYDDIRKIASIADRFGAESVNCIPLRPVTNDPLMRDRKITPDQFRAFVNGLNRLRSEFRTDFVTTLDLRQTASHDRLFLKDRSCAAGREGAVISPYGEIYGCSYSPASSQEIPRENKKAYVAGNILEEDLLRIWNDSARWAIYRDLEKYKHPVCKACSWYLERKCIGNCPIMDADNPAAFDPYCYLYILPQPQDDTGTELLSPFSL